MTILRGERRLLILSLQRRRVPLCCLQLPKEHNSCVRFEA